MYRKKASFFPKTPLFPSMIKKDVKRFAVSSKMLCNPDFIKRLV
jgi:hypothetical protein